MDRVGNFVLFDEGKGLIENNGNNIAQDQRVKALCILETILEASKSSDQLVPVLSMGLGHE